MLKIKDEEAYSFAVVDSENTLLALFSEKEIAATKGYRIIAEKKEGDLVFIPMEDDSLKTFNRSDGIILPRGTITVQQLIDNIQLARQEATVSNEESEKEEPPQPAEIIIGDSVTSEE